MDRVRGWLKLPYGKKLKKLHFWNACMILLLAISGLVLYVPSLRGELGVARVVLKQVHIYAGLLSILVIALYVPLLGKHLKQLRGKRQQQWNLGVVLFILLGWSISGLIMWQYRQLPTHWSNSAVILHDLFTWVGVPYAIFHSISRSQWLKQGELQDRRDAAAANAAADKDHAAAISAPVPSEKDYAPRSFPRRSFIRGSIITVLAVIIGPYFYRFLKRLLDNGGSSLEHFTSDDGNNMLPPPTPAEESMQLAAGGAQGNFRIYTVTDIPSFSSDNWKFSIRGLVEKPAEWNWEQFLQISRKVQVSDFHCVTGWSVYKGTWEGIPLSRFLDEAAVKGSAKYVKFYSGDGVYTDTLTLEQARMEDVMVALLLDGKPLPQKLGGPVRLLVPKMYAYKSVKWLETIELIEKEDMGFWELRGYDTDAWVGKV